MTNEEQQIRKTISDYSKIIQRAKHLANITRFKEKYYYIGRITFSDIIEYQFEYKYNHNYDYEYECLPLKYLWMNDEDVIAEEKALKEEEEHKKKEAKEKADRTLYEELKAKYGNE